MRRILMAAAAALLIGGPAAAQAPVIRCAAPADLAAALLAGFGEMPVGGGVAESGRGIVVFANPSTGSWTVASIAPRTPPKACISDFGTGWTAREPSAPGEPA
jgi:hypothetical protein